MDRELGRFQGEEVMPPELEGPRADITFSQSPLGTQGRDHCARQAQGT